MMSNESQVQETDCTDAQANALLNLYVDGELSSAEQAALFSHLASCADCRMQFNAMLAFRLAARQETFVVPPSADEALLSRIDCLRRHPRIPPERVAARRFFGGQIHRRVSVRSALLAAVVLLGFALAVRPGALGGSAEQRYHVTETATDEGALYVIGPGLTVVEKKLSR